MVELPLFSGPFRLLVDLLLDQKMDVCDVPVARVTEMFLERGATQMRGWELDEATWFLAVCATLLELKVGRLLPRPAPANTEEDLIGGVSPDLLYARSLELAAFRRVAHELAERMARAALLVSRMAGPAPQFAHLYPDPMERVDAELLRETALAVLAPAPDLDLSHVTPIRATLSEAVETVKRHLSARREALFRELLEDCEERIEIVIRFLALLELYREGKVDLSQAAVFGDIEVRWRPQEPGPGQAAVDGSSRATVDSGAGHGGADDRAP
jgi:segregation and condensation protein A